MSDIFISYSSSDRAWVKLLASILKQYGFKVWWDLQMEPGQFYRNTIQNYLDNASCIIVVWSKKSIDSAWVQEEASLAMKQNKLIPVLYQKTRIPLPFNCIQSCNLEEWDGNTLDENFQKLLNSVSMFSNKKIKKTVSVDLKKSYEEKNNVSTNQSFQKISTQDVRYLLLSDNNYDQYEAILNLYTYPKKRFIDDLIKLLLSKKLVSKENYCLAIKATINTLNNNKDISDDCLEKLLSIKTNIQRGTSIYYEFNQLIKKLEVNK